jgi:DNA polymerase-3 subunit epsilon
MIDWLKKINKEYPEFWKKYLSQFDKKPTRFVVLSTETTGLNPEKDVILSIGSVAILNDAIYVGDSFEVVLLQYIYNHDNGLSNEFIIESKQPKFQEAEAIQAFVEYLGNAILIGHRINFPIQLNFQYKIYKLFLKLKLQIKYQLQMMPSQLLYFS